MDKDLEGRLRDSLDDLMAQDYPTHSMYYGDQKCAFCGKQSVIDQTHIRHQYNYTPQTLTHSKDCLGEALAVYFRAQDEATNT